MPGSVLLRGISSRSPGCLPAGSLLPSSPSRQAPPESCLFKAANRLKPGRLPLARPQALHPEAGLHGRTCSFAHARPAPVHPLRISSPCRTSLGRLALLGRVWSTRLVRTSRRIGLPRRGPAHLAACLALTGKMLRIQLLQPTKRYEHSLDRSIPESPRTFGSRFEYLRLSPREPPAFASGSGFHGRPPETRRTT